MNSEITTILSTLSHCTQALFAARADIEEGKVQNPRGSEWRWNDISCKLPDKLVSTLRQLKRIIVQENNTVISFREEQRELSVDSRGKATELAAKNADAEYQERTQRTKFHFLHKCHTLKAEIFPILEICSNELWLANTEGQLYAGEVKLDRCASIQRSALRLLVAMTTLSTDALCEAEDRKVIETESMLTLITTGNLCAVLRHASKLLIRNFGSKIPDNEFEHVEMAFFFFVNLTSIACADRVPLSLKRRFVESFYDSGGIEFIVLVVKTQCGQEQSLERMTTWNTQIVSLLANMFSLVPDPAQWAIISKEISISESIDSEPTQADEPLQTRKPLATPNPSVLPRSMTKSLLTKSSGTGESLLCEHNTDNQLSRLLALDAKKRQKFQRGAKRARNMDELPVQPSAAHSGGSTQLHMIHRFEHIIGQLMNAFLENCFAEWIVSFWPLVYRWSALADDGTEKTEEKEVLNFDNPCPPLIANTFSMLGSICEALRENILYIRSNTANGTLPLEAAQQQLALQKRFEMLLMLLWGKVEVDEQLSDTNAFLEEDANSANTQASIDPSRARTLIKIMPTALKVTTAVHRRKVGREMYVMLKFLLQSLRAAVTFSQWIPDKWYYLVITEGGLWSKTEMILHLAAQNLSSVSPDYLATLLPFVHVSILLMGKHDQLEGESSAVLAIASNPKNLWPYYASLEQWERNPIETNRAIISLFYHMRNLRCHGPLLNIHLLFVLYDIFHKTETSLTAKSQEMCSFTLAMIRCVVSAVKTVGSGIAFPRMLFTLSSSAWHEVTTIQSSVAVADAEIAPAHGIQISVHSDGETPEEAPEVVPKHVPKIQNRDRLLQKEAKQKLRPVKPKPRKERSRRKVTEEGGENALDNADMLSMASDDDSLSSEGSASNSDTEHPASFLAKNLVMSRISAKLQDWKAELGI